MAGLDDRCRCHPWELQTLSVQFSVHSEAKKIKEDQIKSKKINKNIRITNPFQFSSVVQSETFHYEKPMKINENQWKIKENQKEIK